jgi:hypothetical protein
MKRPSIPKTVKVGVHQYRVVLLPKGSPEITEADGSALHGKCDYDSCTIFMQRGLRRTKAQEVLHHEVNHACTYPSLCEKTLTDEEFVDGTSPVSLQVLQDNPALVEYLRTR